MLSPNAHKYRQGCQNLPKLRLNTDKSKSRVPFERGVLLCEGNVPVCFVQTQVYLELRLFPSRPHKAQWLSTGRQGQQMRTNTHLRQTAGNICMVRHEQFEMQVCQRKTATYI